jgi:hypothetical protein
MMTALAPAFFRMVPESLFNFNFGQRFPEDGKTSPPT